MATDTSPPAPKKKSTSFAGMLLDTVAFGVREVALPIPDTALKLLKKKKKVPKK
jgi:hypothetical protein